jgi:hypothetical protein
MSWLTWRQYRLQTILTAALLAAFGAVLLVSGLQLAAQWHAALAGCAAPHACASQPPSLSVSGLVYTLTALGLGVPGVLGILWGAPLAAAEMESGSVNFAWTQGVTRTRWLAVKAGWLLLAAATVCGAVGGLVTWWSGPDNAANADAFRASIFDRQGIVPVGYALFAVALGITAGALLRRTLPAIAVTLAGFIGVRLAVAQYLRPHFLAPRTVYFSLAGGWSPHEPLLMISVGMADRYGRVIPPLLAYGGDQVEGVPASYLSAACRKLVAVSHFGQADHTVSAATQKAIDSCVQASGVRLYESYVPASHYWPYQFIETGIFVALAAALLAIAFAAVRHRDA